MPEIIYGTIHPPKYADANALIQSCLGRDVSIPESAPSPRISVHAAWVNSSLAGIGVASIEYDGSGYLQSLAVLPAHRNLGIATELVRRRVEWLRRFGVRRVSAHSWCSDAFGPQSARALVKNGFALQAVLPLHYSTMSDCPACDSFGCRCDAWLYARDL